MTEREILLCLHTGRQTNLDTAAKVAAWFMSAGVRVRVLADEASDLDPASYDSAILGAASGEGSELESSVGF